MQYGYGSSVTLVGSVSGFRILDADNQFNGILYPSGTAVYLIEFSDGSSVELPETLLAANFNTTPKKSDQ